MTLLSDFINKEIPKVKVKDRKQEVFYYEAGALRALLLITMSCTKNINEGKCTKFRITWRKWKTIHFRMNITVTEKYNRRVEQIEKSCKR